MAEQSQNLPTLTVDSRESRSEVPTWLERLGYKTAMAELQVGDYASEGHIVVERKTASDFVLSLMDGRLFGQAELLANHPDPAVLVIEGSLDSVRSQVEQESLAGALSALTLYFGLTVLPTTSPEQTARVIGRLLMHRVNGLGYDIPTRVGKPKIDGAVSCFILEGLPGVGPQMAKRLLEHFGSAAAVFKASGEELRSVKGVGPKLADGIQHALHHVPSSFRDTKGPAPSFKG